MNADRNATIDKMLTHLDEPGRRMEAIQALRKVMSEVNTTRNMTEDNIRNLILSIPNLLKDFDDSNVQLEALSAIDELLKIVKTRRMSKVIGEDIAAVVDIRLVALLSSPVAEIVNHALSALETIVKDANWPVELNIAFIAFIVKELIKLLEKGDELEASCRRPVISLMDELCVEYNVKFHVPKDKLPLIVNLLYIDDKKALWMACYVMEHFTKDEEDAVRIQTFVDHGCLDRLIQLLELYKNDNAILFPALDAIANIVASNEKHIDAVISWKGLSHITRLLDHEDSDIIERVACFLITIMCTANPQQIQILLGDDIILEQFGKILTKGTIDSPDEAAIPFSKVIKGATNQQILHMMGHREVMKFYCELMVDDGDDDENDIESVLDGLDELFKVAQAAESPDHRSNFRRTLIEIGIVDILNPLLKHPRMKISDKANKFIATYFTEEAAVMPTMTLDEIVLNINDPVKQLDAIRSVRKLFNSDELTSDIVYEIAIGRGLVLSLVQLVNDSGVRYEALLALNNIIAEGVKYHLNYEQQESVFSVAAGVVPSLVEFMKVPVLDIVKDAVWALNKLPCHQTYSSGLTMDDLIPLLLTHKGDKQTAFRARIARLVTNIRLDKNRSVRSNLIAKLLQLLDMNDAKVVEVVLQSIGKIISKDELQIRALMSMKNILPQLSDFLHREDRVAYDTAFLLSLIAAGANQQHIQQLIDSKIIGKLENILNSKCRGSYGRDSASSVIGNIIKRGSHEQILQMIKKHPKIIEAYCKVISRMYCNQMSVGLKRLMKLFDVLESAGRRNDFCRMLKTIDFINELKASEYYNDNPLIRDLTGKIHDNCDTDEEAAEANIETDSSAKGDN